MNLPLIRINPLGFLVICAVAIFFIYLYAGSGNDKKSTDVDFVSLKHLLAICVSAAEAGGLKVKDVRKSSGLKQSSKGKTKEGANDPLTYGDVLSHRTMLYTIKKSFPNIKVVSEEHDENEIEAHDIGPPVSSWVQVDNFDVDTFVPVNDVLVWIDPLDATQEYTVWGWHGRGTSNPSLFTEVKQHEPLASEMASTIMASPVIIVSRSHAGKVKEVARAAFGPDTEVISAGGAGFKSLQVAKGEADAYIHVTLIKKWDICAGDALLHSLGGKMTALDGTPITYGDPAVVKNEKGLIATIHDHEIFVQKLASLAS